jgi:hypothetical protein
MESDSNSEKTEMFIRNLLYEYIEELAITRKTYKENVNVLEFTQYYQSILIMDKYNLNFIKTKKQHGGALCGFHCLFNAVHFIKFIKCSGNIQLQSYYLKKLNSSIHYWIFYKKNLGFLMKSKKVMTNDKIFLQKEKGGSLERYQFQLLLNDKEDIKEKVSSDENNDIYFHTFFFAFGFVQSCRDEAQILQVALEKFRNYKGEKNLIYFILLGITNHWSLLVLENKRGQITFNYLDSTNLSEVFHLYTPDDLLDLLGNQLTWKNGESINAMKMNEEINKFAEDHLNTISQYRKVPEGFFRTCFIQWLTDINVAIKIIMKIVYENFSLYNYILESVLLRFTLKFEEYNMISLENDNNNICKFNFEVKQDLILVKERLINWLKVEYHPQTIESDILNSLNKFKNVEDIKKMKIYSKLKNLFNYIEAIKDMLLIKNWRTEFKEDETEREKAELIDRFYLVMNRIIKLFS